MKNLDIKEFIELRDRLTRERMELEARLQEINLALGGSAAAPPRPMPAAVTARAPHKGATTHRPRNPMTLREAVTQVLTGKSSLTRQDILENVRNLGYEFTGKNPANALGVFLYRNHETFKRANGKFTFAPGASAPGRPTAPSTSAPASKPGKRVMSEAQKRKISETMKKRAAAKRAAAKKG